MLEVQVLKINLLCENRMDSDKIVWFHAVYLC